MERQTRRSQKPLPKGVRVQIPPRAPRTSNGSPRGAVFRRKRAGRRSRFSSGASWRTESFSLQAAAVASAPPRLSHRLHSPVSLFRNSAQQTPRDRHRARLSLPGRDRDAGVARVFPGGESAKGRCTIVSAGGASTSRSLLRRIGPFGNKTREGKGHLLPEHEPAPSRHLPRQRRTAHGDRSTDRGHCAPRLRAARDGISPPASAKPCASQSAREATPESASPSSRTPCPSSSRTHTHSRTAPTSR